MSNANHNHQLGADLRVGYLAESADQQPAMGKSTLWTQLLPSWSFSAPFFAGEVTLCANSW